MAKESLTDLLKYGALLLLAVPFMNVVSAFTGDSGKPPTQIVRDPETGEQVTLTDAFAIQYWADDDYHACEIIQKKVPNSVIVKSNNWADLQQTMRQQNINRFVLVGGHVANPVVNSMNWFPKMDGNYTGQALIKYFESWICVVAGFDQPDTIRAAEMFASYPWDLQDRVLYS